MTHHQTHQNADFLNTVFQQIYESFGPFSREIMRNVNLVGKLDQKAELIGESIETVVKCNTHAQTLAHDQTDACALENFGKDAKLKGLLDQKSAVELEKENILNMSIKMLSKYNDKISDLVAAVEKCPAAGSAASAAAASTASPHTTSVTFGGQKRRLRLSASPIVPETETEPDDRISPDELIYCICRKVSYGNMVACDNKKCPFEWFHFGCVGITQAPAGPWFCQNCSKNRRPKN